MLFNRHQHIGQHRRAGRAGYGEHIGEAMNGNAEIRCRAINPRVDQALAAAPANINPQERAGHCIKAGGVNNGIKRARAFAGLNTVLGNLLNRRAAQIDQRDIVTVIGLIIIRIDARPLGCIRKSFRSQIISRLLVLHRIADTLANKFRHFMIGRFIKLNV